MKDNSRTAGYFLIGLQFALIAVLALLAAPAFVRGEAPWGAWILMATGALLAAWAICHNRPGNFNIHPMPRQGGALIEHGPYRWIRHPMYTAVLACGAACAWAADPPWGWVALVALALVLAAKAALEERLMLAMHPGYAGYRRRTGRFLPGL
jgi:protein-S-isoprenylcysteine O-methyltransferase Ste14